MSMTIKTKSTAVEQKQVQNLQLVAYAPVLLLHQQSAFARWWDLRAATRLFHPLLQRPSGQRLRLFLNTRGLE